MQILGTPTEDDWEGVSQLPSYKPHKLHFYRGQKLGLAFPKLYDILEGESMASALLQVTPNPSPTVYQMFFEPVAFFFFN